MCIALCSNCMVLGPALENLALARASPMCPSAGLHCTDPALSTEERRFEEPSACTEHSFHLRARKSSAHAMVPPPLSSPYNHNRAYFVHLRHDSLLWHFLICILD